MDSKKKRYEINSMVRVPNLDDIKKAAGDFNESQAEAEQNRDFITRNARYLVSAEETNKYNPKLNNIKKEMLQLAMVVASSESEKKEVETDTSAAVESDGEEDSHDTDEVTDEADSVMPDTQLSGNQP